MITARLLNQDAELNNYKQIGGITYVNGDTIRIVVQLFNEELGLRHIPSANGVGDVKLGVNFSDNSFSSIKPGSGATANNVNLLDMTNVPVGAGTSFADDKSIWYVDIITNNAGAGLSTPVTGKTLVGGNITFILFNDNNSIGTMREGIIFNALQRQIVS